MKRKKLGFTMVEILTVVGIIAILVAVLVPALTMVRRVAKETQQKAQLTAIDLAMIAFKSDYGDYPPSNWIDIRRDYCGAQKLAEALLGWDLMGFHPDSEFTSDGMTKDGFEEIYPDPLDTSVPAHVANLEARKGPYLDAGTANAFKLVDLFGDETGLLEKETFVICDVFGIKRVTLANSKTVKAGTPILYYRANTSNKRMTGFPPQQQIYNFQDNMPLIALGKLPALDERHELHEDLRLFYDRNYKIIDPKVKIPWPHRPDSYILISAGADGNYGTSDDICNF